MAHFMTRIELNGNPTRRDYENLHQAMKRKSFSRLIAGSDGNYYHLPHAEYSRFSNLTVDQVRDDAYVAASSVWHDVQVLCAEGLCSWRNLRQATATEISAA